MGKVGYKRPPTHSQFAKGKSGNPKGRPKAASKANSLANIINTPVTVNVDGVPRKMPIDEATVMRLFQSALNGNTAAARLVLQIVEKAQEKKIEEQQNPLGSMPPIARFVLSGPNIEDCSEVLSRLGAMHAIGKDWRLKTWVVEEGLARNIGNNLYLREEDYKKIAKAMTNPEDLPRLREKFG